MSCDLPKVNGLEVLGSIFLFKIYHGTAHLEARLGVCQFLMNRGLIFKCHTAIMAFVVGRVMAGFIDKG